MDCFGRWCRSHPEQAARYIRNDRDNVYASPIFAGKEASGTRRLAEQVPDFRGAQLREVEELAAEAIHGAGLPQPPEFRRARFKDGGREA